MSTTYLVFLFLYFKVLDMRIAISAKNCQVDNTIAPLFYKCKMFCVFDTDLNRANFYENPYYKQEPGYEKELTKWLQTKGVTKAYSFRFRDEMHAKLIEAGITVSLIPDQETVMIDVIDTFTNEA